MYKYIYVCVCVWSIPLIVSWRVQGLSKAGAQVEEFERQFLKQAREMFPPVFHKWFLYKFTEPTEWFENRLIYIHSTAVWSIVGYCVGLGDRHGENILIDEKNGEAVHVDFDCLFDKGLSLEKPEVVPFRLTSNIVDAMGVTGYDGVFRRSCEVALAVMRSHQETLMGVLETFIHDPLVEWKDPQSKQREIMNNIRQRLSGTGKDSLALSVSGQVHQLISAAASDSNLAKMSVIVRCSRASGSVHFSFFSRRYIGWMPWL